MNLLILIKNNNLDQSIINFTNSLFKSELVSIYLLNIVPTSGEVPTQINGRVLDFCTEFDLSDYISKTENNRNFLASFKQKSIVQRDSFAGNTIRIIQDYIKTNKIDLIIAGAHKTNALEDLYIKTFAVNAIENTATPYLTIKCNRDNFIPKKIALVGDFENNQTEKLDVLKFISKIHNSHIILTKVHLESDHRTDVEIQNAMNTFAEMNNLQFDSQIIHSKTLESGILTLQFDTDTDLIAMPHSHKKSIFEYIGHTEQTNIINHIYAPILIY